MPREDTTPLLGKTKFGSVQLSNKKEVGVIDIHGSVGEENGYALAFR